MDVPLGCIVTVQHMYSIGKTRNYQILFIYGLPEEKLTENHKITKSAWTTLFISGGRKDKISKGDIAGLFFKIGKLKKDQLGIIELKSDCAFVAVATSAVNSVLQKVDNQRVKKKKVRVYTI